MADVSLNRADVLSGELALPLRGRWTFTGQIDSAGPPPIAMQVGDAASLSIVNEDGSTTLFTGTIADYADWQGRAGVRVVAGTGGLSVPLPPQGYSAHPLPVTLLELLKDLAELTGETLSETTVAYAADVTLTAWSRSGDGVAALDALGAELGIDWRMTDAGEIDFVPTTFPVVLSTDLFFLDDEGNDGIITVTPTAATLRPATTLQQRLLTEVVYRFEPDRLRADLIYHTGERAELERAVRRQLPELPYVRPYKGTITRVEVDGTLQVLTEELGTLGRVELLVGSPRMKVTPSEGDVVRVAFAAARPSQYYAFALEQDEDADKPVARVGDRGIGGTFTAMVGNVPVTFTYTPPGGAPAEPGATVSIEVEITSGHPDIRLTNKGQ